MEHHITIDTLKRRLLIERIASVCVILALIAGWAFSGSGSEKAFILIDGEPVACLASEQDARQVIDKVKRSTGVTAAEVQFKKEVSIARAPRSANLTDRSKAERMVEKEGRPLVPKWAIIADGKPVVAVADREMAGEVLDLAKFRFGSKVKNLVEEPQFAEDVTVDIASVELSMYFDDADGAMEYLFAKKKSVPRDATYKVKKGDVASVIAERHRLSLKQLAALNPSKSLEHLQIGDKLNVKQYEMPKPKLTVVVRDQIEEKKRIDPPVHKVSSARLYSGQTKTLSEGESGLKKVKVARIYENGRLAGKEVIEEVVLKQPEPRRIACGIRPRPAW